jgi:hypothetical protein
MEPVVISFGKRGRTTPVWQAGLGHWVSSPIPSLLAVTVLLAGSLCAKQSRGQGPPSQLPAPPPPKAQHTLVSRDSKASARPLARTPGSVPVAHSSAQGSARRVTAPPATEAIPLASKRFKVRDEYGDCVVARFHGQLGNETALVLPDGQLGKTNVLVATDEPFQPLAPDQLQTVLQAGPFAEYHLLKTNHYLIFYKSTLAFAQDSGRLLDDLYDGLLEAFLRNGFPVHETEFPLVAVIFATESDFRKHKPVDPQVQAYYEFFTNRIFFYQKSELDQFEPKVSALLRPQTVAHEGAHQILSNIGLQPRPCNWPLWLVEGLAEYCATTVNTKKGIAWSGMGGINSLHMATLRELDDPLSNQVNGADVRARNVARQRPMIQSGSLLLKPALTPTDYAGAWALTHYLARKHGPDFVKFLKAMSQVPPLQPRTAEENLAEFRRFFECDPSKLDKKLDDYIRKVSQKKSYDPLPYYTVIFAQPLGNGVMRRAAMVSQSPQMVQQWVQEMTAPQGGAANWEAITRPTRARAILAAEEWMRSL